MSFESDASADRRRKSPRAGCVLQLHYRNAGHLLVSYCTNLSRGGLFVPSSEPLPPGSRLTLSMTIPGESKAVEIEAEVRWVRQFNAAEGPAGMGLAFEDVDDLLGERIDGIVSDFAPLDIALVGNRAALLKHLAAQVQSLVSCRTTVLPIDSMGAAGVERLAERDLVVVDVDSAPDFGLALLRDLSRSRPAPPRIALCDARDLELRGRAVKLARVLPSPVDAEDLRTNVLEAITQVEAAKTYSGE